MVSRRWFIGGAAAFGAFGGNRFFACFGGEPLERPKLRLGVVSDVHVCVYGSDKGVWGTELLKAAFEYYRDRQVDAIVIPGDLADQGYGEGLRAVAKTWREVFPDDKLPDGRKVEKVFVFGNHDFGGAWYTDWGKKRYASDAERAADNLRIHPEKLWREAFEEDYSPFYRKEIRGFTFFGQHWDNGSRQQESGKVYPFGDLLKEHLADPKNRPDPSKPFFYVQHPHPKNTCYGSWAWGHDDGVSTEVLSAYPNAIALSGHSHYALTDERTIWQGAFTSVGASSLRFVQNSPGCDNGNETPVEGSDTDQLLPPMDAYEGRQGMFMTVYDDSIRLERREFLYGESLGDDWIIPLGTEERPYAPAFRARHEEPPRFPRGAALRVVRESGKDRLGKDRQFVTALFPPARPPSGEARTIDYEVRAMGGGRVIATKRVFSPGQILPASRDAGDVVCRFDATKLPDAVRFEVRPRGAFGAVGAALACERR